MEAEVSRLAARADRRAEITATLLNSGHSVLCSSVEQALEVVNEIAPEHVELMVADPEALVPQVRNAGAVFCGPWAPASVGDYAAGPNHVLPTNGTARFASALGVRDFIKSMHVVSTDRAGLRGLAPHVIALAEAEGLTAHAESVRLRLDAGRVAIDAGTDVMTEVGAATGLARPRDDIALMAGYHSPQLDVAVRLNTNESPLPPPSCLRRRGSGRGPVGGLEPVPGPAGPRAQVPGSRPATAWTRIGSLLPTAPTRCSSACCSPMAAPGAAWRCSSPATRCTRTWPGSPGLRSSRGRATTTSRSTPQPPRR